MNEKINNNPEERLDNRNDNQWKNISEVPFAGDQIKNTDGIKAEEQAPNNPEQSARLASEMQPLVDMDNKIEDNTEKEHNGKVNRVYGEIAKNALMNWNNLSEQEALEKVANSTHEELEAQIGASNSIIAAIRSTMENLEKRGLVDHEERFDVGDGLVWGLVEDSDEDLDKSIGILSEKLENVTDKEEFVLDVLGGIHNEWIKDNMEKLNDHNRANKRYQFMPLSVIGFKEAKADLIFVEPLLETAGMNINQEELQDAYADYHKNIKDLFNIDNKYSFNDTFKNVVNFQNQNPEPYEYVLRVLNFRAQLYQVETDENFGIDISNVEGGSFEVIETKRVSTTPGWGVWDRYSSPEENLRAAEEAKQGWAYVTERREPTRQEYAARYAMEIANQVIDKLEADRQ